MTSINLYAIDGTKTGDLPVPSAVLDTPVNERLVAQYIRMFQTNQRSGNSSTKTRSEVTATRQKVYRQKGTGRARHGNRTSNVFVGGGITFGPKPKEYLLKMTKKQKRKALFNALMMQVTVNNVSAIVDDILSIQPKTSEIRSVLETMSVFDKKILFLVPNTDSKTLLLSTRNLKNVAIESVTNVNPYLLMAYDRIIFIEAGFKLFNDFFVKTDEN